MQLAEDVNIKKFKDDEDIEQHIRICQSFYDDVVLPFPISVGKAASKRERDQLNLLESTLVYGEISFDSFAKTVLKLRTLYGGLSKGGIFYDLGSGTGKPVIAAAIVHNFDSCIGIEILEGLYSISMELLISYKSLRDSRSFAKTGCRAGDILSVHKWWLDADVVFANSTCFDDVLMLKIARRAALMKKGTFFISFTRSLPSVDFMILEYELHRMSWGDATVFISQKVTEPKNLPPTDDDTELL